MDLDFLIRAARYDHALCFNKGYDDIMNMQIMLTEKNQAVEMLLDAAVLNNSVRVLRTMYRWRSSMMVSHNAHCRALCRTLINCDNESSREMFNILWGNDNRILNYYVRDRLSESNYSLDCTSTSIYTEVIIAASKAESRWGLDTLFELCPSYFGGLSSDSLLQHIRDNNLEMVNAMIEYGFDIHVGDDAALSVASRNCNPEIIKVLLKNGAKISGHGYKALRKAIINANAEVMHLYAVSAWDALEKDVPIDLAIKFIKKTLSFRETGINHNGLAVKLRRLRLRKEEEEVG